MTYRCQGCREYQRGVPYRRLGLGAVCSAACVAQAAERQRDRSTTTKSPPTGVPSGTHAAVLARDGGCRYCGARVGLHVHHIRYRSEGVDHSEANLITLCAEHHGLVHSDKGRWQPVLRAYIAELYAGRKHYLLDIDRRLDRRHL